MSCDLSSVFSLGFLCCPHNTHLNTHTPSQVASETLTWLRSFDMESRLLSQLAELKGEAKEAVGRGLFSGVDLGVDLCLSPVLFPLSLPRPLSVLAPSTRPPRSLTVPLSGFSIMVELIVREIPDVVPKTGTVQLLARLQV